MRQPRASRRLLPSPAKKAPFHGHFTQSFRPKTRCLMCPVSRALSHEAPPFVPEGAASRSRTQHLGLKSRNTKKAQATKDRRRAAARRSVHADAGSQNLPFFAPSLLALLIRGGQSHPDQTPDGVGTGWMAGLPAAPFIDVLLPLQLKSKTDDWICPIHVRFTIEWVGGESADP